MSKRFLNTLFSLILFLSLYVPAKAQTMPLVYPDAPQPSSTISERATDANGNGLTGSNSFLIPYTIFLPYIFRTIGIKSISAGGAHTCIVTTSGGVKCWGVNISGELGDGTTIDRSYPVDVVGLSSGVKAIAVGGEHTCALTTSGGVKCWGWNGEGQLGDGTTNSSSIPVDVVGLSSGVQAIAAGGEHTCALTTSGGIKCWGVNYNGQLGDGTTTNSPIPVDVEGLPSAVSSITVGGKHTCALTEFGGVKCWGANWIGQLGDGTDNDSTTPMDVVELSSGVQAVAAGDNYTCALTTSGGVKCWGGNWYGQLGDGTTIDSSTPVDVVGLSSMVQAISTGGYHSCALTTSGTVKCWGINRYGQLGDGTVTNRYTPINVLGLTTDVLAIAVGGAHTCALIASDGVKCWGNNFVGQLGDGTTLDYIISIPVDVVGLSTGVQEIDAGYFHTCALTDSGVVKCWGFNEDGQLGNGTDIEYSIPMDVVGLSSGVVSIAAGLNHTCALIPPDSVKCWGSNEGGKIGDGTIPYSYTPINVVGLSSEVQSITAGGHHTCTLTASGGVKCWGTNWAGQLGDGTTTDNFTPVDVVGLSSGVQAIAAGGYHTCALTSSGGIKCWGSNRYGQLGDGTNNDSSTPVDVVGLSSGVKAITVGVDHTCALTTSGVVKCWGKNWSGQLGDGTISDRYTPVNVIGVFSRVKAISAGIDHTCALMDSGIVKCWGDNWYGQLGNNTTSNQSIPVDVVGLYSKVKALTAGGGHTCALTILGGVKCWGRNDSGQLGNGINIWSSTPVDVFGLP
jgi:alpha-tubulin suppressor-like RCC1 family protein